MPNDRDASDLLLDSARLLEPESSPACVETYSARAVLEARAVVAVPTLADAPELGLLATCAPGAAGPTAVQPPPPIFAERYGRYEVLHEIGRGAMGHVVEAVDPELRRRVAIKIIRDPSAVSDVRLARFVAEAQITSQLEHPSIIPVYDMGATAAGELYYAMKKVEGRTLNQLLAELRRGDPSTTVWTRERLLGAFQRVCEAMAYAHERGVLHRDLKPENVMLGRFGEVLVLDWGVARMLGDASERVHAEQVERIEVKATLDGSVIGTPGYMSPEQASGSLLELDRRSDVWSLGSILYELITHQHAYEGGSIYALMLASMTGPPVDPRERAPHLNIPDEIAELCLCALATDKAQRVASAAELASQIQAFLDGSLRRARAREILATAAALEPESSALRDHAAALRQDAAARLEEIPAYAGVAAKRAAWAMQDDAKRLDQMAERAEVEFRYAMNNALNHAPELREPHLLLSDHFRRRHERAEASGNERSAEVLAMLLQRHDQGAHTAYLAGQGALSVVTEPPGAQAELLRYVERDRRLQLEPVSALGTTPLVGVPLDMGSYLLTLSRPGYVTARYPVCIERGLHWNGVRPGDSDPTPITLPLEGALGADEVYVAAGWFWSGEDDHRMALPRRRLWIDGFAISRFPVTNAKYINFLDDLVATGREADALRWVPRERAGSSTEQGAVIYGRGEDGGFLLREDADGDLWVPDEPVAMIDWHCARAYCAWLAERTGQPWRLPWELEWEKAARGVDARDFPWGNALDPSWCCMRHSHAGGPKPALVTDFPVDESVYGVRGLGGNAVDWCADLLEPNETPPASDALFVAPSAPHEGEGYRAYRGGSWYDGSAGCRSVFRHQYQPQYRVSGLAFRPVRTWPGREK